LDGNATTFKALGDVGTQRAGESAAEGTSGMKLSMKADVSHELS
jgi:hypothetical protein